VGVFLLGAATSVVRSVRDPGAVRDAMSPAISVEPDLLISRFVDEILPLHRYSSFPVTHGKSLLGILTLADLKKLPREQWRDRRVRDAMRAVNSSMFVEASTNMDAANELMVSNGVDALAVIGEAGELVGFLRRGRAKRKK
jgi:CBS domain-containing protein